MVVLASTDTRMVDAFSDCFKDLLMEEAKMNGTIENQQTVAKQDIDSGSNETEDSIDSALTSR